ncbi:hypothetical protein BJX64DRAFT_276188 [Aspergillus heterothallicus]
MTNGLWRSINIIQTPTPNGGTVAGIHSIPIEPSPSLQHPRQNSALGVPFISIDRPCYGGTSSFLPIPKDFDYAIETDTWLHRYILPTLWAEFGVPSQCNCIVLLSHSLGAIGSTVVGAMHAQDQEGNKSTAYPLGGIIISGLGGQLIPSMVENPLPEPNAPPDHAVFPVAFKDALMFVPAWDRSSGYPSLHGGEWAAHIVAPVKFTLVDCFWVGSEEHVRSCVEAFKKRSQVDGSLVRGAPHCLELSVWSQGWCAASFSLQAV